MRSAPPAASRQPPRPRLRRGGGTGGAEGRGGRHMSSTTERGPGPAADPPLAELVKQLSEQSSRLARQELELAKAELATKGKRARIGGGMFRRARPVGLYAVCALVAAAVLGLATAVAAWLAALIVAAVLAAVAGVLALQGKT